MLAAITWCSPCSAAVMEMLLSLYTALLAVMYTYRVCATARGPTYAYAGYGTPVVVGILLLYQHPTSYLYRERGS